MSEKHFKDLYSMGEEHVFTGLSPSSRKFLRNKGLWGPIDQTLIDTLPGLSSKKDLIYVSRVTPEDTKGKLMFLLVEKGEYLQGVVHDLMYEPNQEPITFHEYQLVDGTTAKEEAQIIIDDELFLYLYGTEDVVLGEWSEQEIEDYLGQPY